MNNETDIKLKKNIQNIIRTRRNRQSDWVRNLVAEVCIKPTDLIYPIFVCEGTNIKNPISSMPGVYVLSIDKLVTLAQKAWDLGIPAIALFPHIENHKRSDSAEESYNPNNLICRAMQQITKTVPDIGVIADIALDGYTTTGHDGVTNKSGDVCNDTTVELLARQAYNFAQAGCSFLGLSDMMDGRVRYIRDYLDQQNFHHIGLMSYAVKYASSFYGPFREATGSQQFLDKKDKRTYQMDPRNAREALRELSLDVDEGADILIIKPGMPYLDIIKQAKERFLLPIFAYQVSGEYAMMKAASQAGWLSWDDVIMESLVSFKRAGADAIITYAALDVAEKL